MLKRKRTLLFGYGALGISKAGRNRSLIIRSKISMTESWLCDGVCGRHFTGTKNRIRLERKIRNGPNKHEYITYLDICTDCEQYEKRR